MSNVPQTRSMTESVSQVVTLLGRASQLTKDITDPDLGMRIDVLQMAAMSLESRLLGEGQPVSNWLDDPSVTHTTATDCIAEAAELATQWELDAFGDRALDATRFVIELTDISLRCR